MLRLLRGSLSEREIADELFLTVEDLGSYPAWLTIVPKAATTDAPPFAAIARRPDFDPASIEFFLRDPHPKMPNMSLSRKEAEDLLARIQAQKAETETIAAEMLLVAEPISGRRAYEVGLVGHVVPDGQALTKAREIAATVAASGPLAVQNIKASIIAADALPEADAFQRELELGMAVMSSKDAREGPKAFLEKRTPDFTGQ